LHSVIVSVNDKTALVTAIYVMLVINAVALERHLTAIAFLGFDAAAV
jgi:hypothetical protein